MQKFKTSYLLWAACTLALFVPCWFIPWLGKGDTSFAAMLRAFRAGLPLTDLPFFVLAYGLPAIIIGWVLQALVIICLRRKREETHVT